MSLKIPRPSEASRQQPDAFLQQPSPPEHHQGEDNMAGSFSPSGPILLFKSDGIAQQDDGGEEDADGEPDSHYDVLHGATASHTPRAGDYV
eukprot:871466_1